MQQYSTLTNLMTKPEEPFWKTEDDDRLFDEFTKTSFARIYPAIAIQILERTGITIGTCLDAGSGPAPLAMAIASQSDLRVTALDSSPVMYSLAVQNIHTRNLEKRVIPILGNVHAIPLGEKTCDLVVSRGSYHFWTDLPGAFREVYRILKSGGKAYIGGGYGSREIRDEVLATRKRRGMRDGPGQPVRNRFHKFRAGEIESSIEAAGISKFQIINDDSGFWMLFEK